MAAEIHEIAAKGFQAAPEAYDRGCPEYPLDALEHLVRALNIGALSAIVELGAGTGKFTKLFVSLLPAGARVVAVEPVEGMRKKFWDDQLPPIFQMNLPEG